MVNFRASARSPLASPKSEGPSGFNRFLEKLKIITTKPQNSENIALNQVAKTKSLVYMCGLKEYHMCEASG